MAESGLARSPIQWWAHPRLCKKRGAVWFEIGPGGWMAAVAATVNDCN
ncbi:unnamed protein product [Acidithrix sp. C25]|nr:unnamed protein product [Acidithrix sp. C25]